MYVLIVPRTDPLARPITHERGAVAWRWDKIRNRLVSKPREILTTSSQTPDSQSPESRDLGPESAPLPIAAKVVAAITRSQTIGEPEQGEPMKEGLYIVAYNFAYCWLVVWDWVWICDIQTPDSQTLKFSDL
jgi:hypothetical protein